jgi:hypothetical protein
MWDHGVEWAGRGQRGWGVRGRGREVRQTRSRRTAAGETTRTQVQDGSGTEQYCRFTSAHPTTENTYTPQKLHRNS